MSPAVTLAQALGSRERQEDRARVEVGPLVTVEPPAAPDAGPAILF